jgi:hypothetical protein
MMGYSISKKQMIDYLPADIFSTDKQACLARANVLLGIA